MLDLGMNLFKTSGLNIYACREIDIGDVYYLAEWWSSSTRICQLIRNAAEYNDWRDFAKEAMTEYVKYLTAAIDKLQES